MVSKAEGSAKGQNLWTIWGAGLALQGPLSVADSGPGWVPHHSGCFTAAGLRENAESVSGEAKFLDFESGRWMFWERHGKFWEGHGKFNAAMLGFTEDT